ncbi:MAG: phosphocholine cytidylyltransferase family protein [Phycisphaeraceae bacterium]
MNVVILAAGTGSRLLPLTRNTPKSLLDLGNGYTLLERQLQAVAGADLHKVTLVTGYKAEQIEAKIQHYADFEFHVIYNPFYRMANNLVSAWMALKGATEPTILVNGDDLFKTDIVGTLAKSTHDITMVISRKDAYDDDDMKVIIEDNRVVDVGKDIHPAKADGESIGMMLFQGPGLREIQRQLSEMVRHEDQLQLFYLAALRALMRAGAPVHFVEARPEDWAEVDFHPDLLQMRQQLEQSLPRWE